MARFSVRARVIASTIIMAATGAFVAPALGVGVPLLIRNTGSSMPRGKLAKSPEWHWRRLDGSERLAQVIDGVHFRDGEPVQEAEDQAAA